jgi:hypothetical protein
MRLKIVRLLDLPVDCGRGNGAIAAEGSDRK